MNAPVNSVILAALVDRLAAIKAQGAALALEETAIKAELVASGAASIDGTLHRVAVSQCAGRVTVDWAAVAAKFNPSHQLVTAHTSTGAPFAVVRVSARKG